MKTMKLPRVVLLVALAALNPALGIEKKEQCAEVIKQLEEEITKEPTRVLLAVEDALMKSEECACEIIDAAIKITKADPKLVGEIVTSAINTAPSVASTIGRCALAAAPQASTEITKSMKNALGEGDSAGKEPVGDGKTPVASGKEPVSGKTPVASKEPDAEEPVVVEAASTGGDDLGGSMDVSGVYFGIPGGSGGGGGSDGEEVIVKIIKEKKGKKKPHTGSTPATTASPQ